MERFNPVCLLCTTRAKKNLSCTEDTAAVLLLQETISNLFSPRPWPVGQGPRHVRHHHRPHADAAPDARLSCLPLRQLASVTRAYHQHLVSFPAFTHNLHKMPAPHCCVHLLYSCEHCSMTLQLTMLAELLLLLPKVAPPTLPSPGHRGHYSTHQSCAPLHCLSLAILSSLTCYSAPPSSVGCCPTPSPSPPLFSWHLQCSCEFYYCCRVDSAYELQIALCKTCICIWIVGFFVYYMPHCICVV